MIDRASSIKHNTYFIAGTKRSKIKYRYQMCSVTECDRYAERN